MRFWFGAMICLSMMGGGPVSAAIEGRLTVGIGGLTPDHRFSAQAAFCASEGTATRTYNISPEVRWSKGPAATRSYALLMVDPDVPANLTLIDRPGVTIAADAPRQPIYHWVLADIAASVNGLDQGADGSGLVLHGKPVGIGPVGVRGANDYTRFFHDMPSMAGTYGGYDGPWRLRRHVGYRSAADRGPTAKLRRSSCSAVPGADNHTGERSSRPRDARGCQHRRAAPRHLQQEQPILWPE